MKKCGGRRFPAEKQKNGEVTSLKNIIDTKGVGFRNFKCLAKKFTDEAKNFVLLLKLVMNLKVEKICVFSIGLQKEQNFCPT